MRTLLLFPIILVALVVLPKPATADAEQYDVVVYGGTSSGVVAAVQAARMGKEVVLIEPGQHLGGLSSGGLGATDTGRKGTIGGLSREFYQRIKSHYDERSHWTHATQEAYGPYRPDAETMWRFEPHVAEAVFNDMVREEDVTVVLGQRLDRERGVHKQAGRITAIDTESNRTFAGRMFIDATYEGDLMAAAGVSYTVGRESSDKYGEKLSGIQKRRTDQRVGDYVEPVDPYVVAGDPSSRLLPGVHDENPGRDGQADDRVQAYCFRMCLTDVPENRVPFPKPEDYDPQRYELMLRYFESGQHRIPWLPKMMPNRKTDTNNHGFVLMSTDYIGGNYEYPEADYETREQIIADHERYQKGLMWTLANHPRVPDKVREEVSRWGLAKDEFTDNGHWPHQLYIREARRMVGRYVMTTHDCRGTRDTPRPVGMGSYPLDSHHVQRYVTEDGHARNEGNLYGSTDPYPIAYGALTPKKEECANLLVPVSLSASHVAFGSIRMEPVFMVLGQSAATAAVHAIEQSSAVQEVDYSTLRDRLLADGQVLEHQGGGAKPAVTNAENLDGIVLDDDDAELTGEWANSSKTAGYVGGRYLHDESTARGKKQARYVPDLSAAGRYKVRVSYTPHSNRATNARIIIRHAGGRTRKTINQRKSPQEAPFITLGQYRFQKGKRGAVVISNEGANGYVIADAVQFLPVE